MSKGEQLKALEEGFIYSTGEQFYDHTVSGSDKFLLALIAELQEKVAELESQMKRLTEVRPEKVLDSVRTPK